LWYFHVYMYHNPNCFISSNFLHSILVPFLLWCGFDSRYVGKKLCVEVLTSFSLSP
jgi:hypothetical protein